MYIGLTTCPHHASGNVGDQLITDASLKLLEHICGDIEVNIHFRREDFTSRIEYLNSADAIFLFGFPIAKSDTRPKYYRIANNLDDVETPIIPLGAAHSFFPGTGEELRKRNLSPSTRSFINEIITHCPGNKLPVRTEWVSDVLNQNGYETVLTGDPAWYDPEMIGKSFHKPDHIENLMFTTPHRSIYLNQAKELIKRITHRFQDTAKTIVLHSVPTESDQELSKMAEGHGWAINHASHDTKNLASYRESDLHIGYRKHGHLAHLRWRRPSVVIAEDSRSQGLTRTFGCAGYPAFKPRDGVVTGPLGRLLYNYLPKKEVNYLLRRFNLGQLRDPEQFVASADPDVIENALQFIDYELMNDWSSYDAIADKIDLTYKERMKPYIRSSLNIN